MVETTLSSKFQVVIPKEVRTRLKLKKGQKLVVIAKGGIISLIPQRSLSKIRGFLKGMDREGLREERDRL